MALSRQWIVTLVSVLLMSSRGAAQDCLYTTSSSLQPTTVQVYNLKENTPMNGIRMTGFNPEKSEEARTTWGLTQGPDGKLLVVESGQAVVFQFDPFGDPHAFSEDAEEDWALAKLDRDTPIDTGAIDKRFSFVFELGQRPMVLRFSPSGQRAAVFVSANPDGVIGYVLDNPLDLTKQKVRVIREFPELQTNGPYHAITWLSETELVLCTLAPGMVIKLTLSDDPAVETFDLKILHESQKSNYWTIWFDKEDSLMYLGCAESGVCVEVLDLDGNIVRETSSNGGSVYTLKIDGDNIILSGRDLGVRVVDKYTFEQKEDYSAVVANIVTAFAFLPCPTVDFDPSATSGSDNKYLPLYIVIAVGVVGIIATLMFAVVLRRRAKRVREEGEAQSKGYRPDESFFTDLVGVRRDPVVPVVPTLEPPPESLNVPFEESKPSDTMIQFTALRQQLAAALGDSASDPKSAGVTAAPSLESNVQIPNTMSSDTGGDPSLEEGRPLKKSNKATGGYIGAFESLADSSVVSNAAASGGALYQRITRIPPEDVDIQGYVGSGGFADVFLGIWKEIPVAVKILRDGTSESAAEQFKKELFILTQLRHPNVTLMMGAMEGKRLAMVTEYLEGGSLHNTLRSYREEGKRLPWVSIYTIARDIACGLLYLHTRTPPLVHRDIKSANIFLDKHGRAHVGDFGLSKEILSASRSMTQVVGTPAWMAPELVQVGDSPENYTTKVDVYAYAVTVFEMVAMCEPFEGESTISILRRVVRKPETRPPFPEGSHALWKSFIESLWVTNPEDRPDFSSIVEYLTANEQALRSGEGAAKLPPPIARVSANESDSKTTDVAPIPSLVGVSAADTSTDGGVSLTLMPDKDGLTIQDSSSPGPARNETETMREKDQPSNLITQE